VSAVRFSVAAMFFPISAYRTRYMLKMEQHDVFHYHKELWLVLGDSRPDRSQEGETASATGCGDPSWNLRQVRACSVTAS
jgi:hypothetical protein